MPIGPPGKAETIKMDSFNGFIIFTYNNMDFDSDTNIISIGY